MGVQHKWGKASLEKLATCDPRLVAIIDDVLLHFPHDVTVIEGARTNERQEELFAEGKSKLRAGQSAHNVTAEKPLSRAIDVAPLVNGKIDWKDRELWIGFAGFVRGIAAMHGVDLIWGGDWDGDFDSAEHGFWDGPHFELKGKR